MNDRTNPVESKVTHIGGWYVEVAANGERVLCISDDSVTGLDDIEPFAPIIRTAAAHLLSFIGPGVDHVGAHVSLAPAMASAAPADKVTCARMGHGVVSIGECFSPELEEPGIICMELPEQRDIGLDTGDVFPKGLRPPADKILAYISFANPAAIDQTIGVLQRIKAKHFPASSPADERAECIAWAIANGFTKYHESMCAAWEERARRAAASPAAEAVALTDEGIIQLFEEKADVDLEVYHGIAASTVLSFARALLAAPQPAQADAPAEAREPIAWMTDDDRAITAAQKQRALADGGATASSVRPYSIPCYAVSAPADAGEARLTDAARDMLAERRRQVEAEGWTPEHDDQYQHGAIALAAACYAANAGGVAWADPLPSFWPWMHNWWKPTTPRRDLVKAGALILAELERLDRAALLNGADHDR